ncbi:MAG: helix-turn-helix transcriptional regulator [Clostridia bacterium]|nr:helix-turn-helix transcriptional regulator [Clostridia bacterium]
MAPFYNDLGEAVFKNVALAPDFPIAASVNASSDPRVDSFQFHFHSCMEFLVVHSQLEIIGPESDSFTAQKGSVVLFYPHIAHSIRFKSDVLVPFDSIFINSELLLSFTDSFPSDIVFPQSKAFRPGYRVFTHDSHPAGFDTCQSSIRELSRRSYGWRFCSVSNALLLLAYVERTNGSLPANPPRRENTVEIRPALNYMDKNYFVPIYLELLSELCHMSQATFRRKFKKIMNCTPLDYLQSLRIQHACMMLRNTTKPITEISALVGFETISSFNRQFLAIKGISPKQYRTMSPEEDTLSAPID